MIDMSMEKHQMQDPEHLYQKLVQKIREYRPHKSLAQLDKAYTLAKEAHEGQLRKSGEPYINHPIEVAIILAELKLDMESIVAGILHDIVEDTDYTEEDIVALFGEEVAHIVIGVTKLLKMEYKKKDGVATNAMAETYKRMFLAMAKDIRVILIKIADRLHNMRTLNYMTPKKQIEKARETIEIYAPIALRLGISKIRNELEDLSFRYLEPQEYYALKGKIQTKQTTRQKLVDEMLGDLKGIITQELSFEFRIEGRPKHFFSIYKKMRNKQLTIEEIYDLFALRIIVDTTAECYLVLGKIHEHYQPIQGRFKDYISSPKRNMYQSIHTTIIGPAGEPFEVQIRTKDMHEVAEHGIAAHWKYKSTPGETVNVNSEEQKLNWLKKTLEWQRDFEALSGDDESFLQELKSDFDIYKNSVFCYTPNGDVVELKVNSTPVDFAYTIHSAVGNNMTGAKVNSVMVPFDHKLKTDDRVEILTSRSSTGPKAEWLNFVQTGQAKNRIRAWLKQENKLEDEVRGKELLEQEAIKRKEVLSELLTENRQQKMLVRYNYVDWGVFLSAVGRRAISEEQVIKRLINERDKEVERARQLALKNATLERSGLELAELVPITKGEKKKAKSKSGVIVQGLGDTNIRFPHCCSPIPGDEIIGFITKGRGVSVHRTDCDFVSHISEIEKQRLIAVSWDMKEVTNKDTKFNVSLRIEAEDRGGLLVDIYTIFAEFKMSITALNAKSSNNSAVIKANMDVDSREQLEAIYTRISNLKGVYSVVR